MSDEVVVWPPNEPVALIGRWSTPQVAGAAVAVAVVVIGIATSRLLVPGTVAVGVGLWTFVSWRGVPVRTRTGRTVRWLCRHPKVWSAPVRARTGGAPCLAGFRLTVTTDPAQSDPIGVVEAPDGSFTVVVDVDATSLAFQPTSAQAALVGRWGEVLGALCVERGTGVTAERVAWTDVHRAGDPTALAAYHHTHGTPGVASADYAAFVAGCGTVASEHRVLVSVTVTRAGQLRTARRHGLRGTVREVMHAAAVTAGRQLVGELERHGFTVGPFLSPAGIARVILETGDPHLERPAGRSGRERFGIPDRVGPDHVEVDRHFVAVDRSYHRVFQLGWPRVPVLPDWFWRPLGVDGPKVTTVVFEPVAPSTADSRRDALTTRSTGNNLIVRRLRTVDQRKTAALVAAERAVADGHHDLDGYALVVVSARSLDELDRRCQQLVGKLREAGRANARELTGRHDTGWVAALPLGLWCRAATEKQ